MKKLLLLGLALFSLQTASSQAEFAPIGAKWWVLIEEGIFGGEYINTYECTGMLDTLGYSFKVVHERSFDGLESDLLFFQDGHQVYFHDSWTGSLMLVFDYSKSAGEQYTITAQPDSITFMVDSVYNQNFGNNGVNVQRGITSNPAVEFDHPQNWVYEGIGTYQGLLPKLPSEITFEIWNYLACYLHPDGTLYDFEAPGNIDCQALTTLTSPQPESPVAFSIYPNPATDALHCQFPISEPLSSTSVKVLGMDGRTMLAGQPTDGADRFSFTVNDWPSGVYCVQLWAGGALHAVERFVVAR